MKKSSTWVAAAAIAISIGCGSRSGLLVSDLPALEDSGADAGDTAVSFDAPPIDFGTDVLPVACPVALPKATDACPGIGAVCTYRRGKVGPCSDASANDQVVFRCEKDGWLEVARCIDPTACPATPPVEMMPCAQNGLDCFYSNATCGPESIMQCETGVWVSVNDCGARKGKGPCVPVPTLVGDQRILLSSAGSIADRTSFVSAGTQLLAAWIVTPELGGSETLNARALQTAVPSMAAPFPFEPFGTLPADVMPAVDFARDRFVIAWGSKEVGSPGAFDTSPVLDAPIFATPRVPRLDDRPVEQVDVATRAHDGGTLGWVAYRSRLGDFKSGIGTLAVPIDHEGAARGPLHVLADEAPHDPSTRLHHAWAAVSQWKDGFVLVSSVGASGDLWDDTGISIWFIADPTSSSLPPPVRVAVGQTIEGDVVATRDGTVVVVTMPEGAPSGTPYALVSVRPDGTSTKLPPPELGVAIAPRPPRLVPFEEGFALVFAAEKDRDPDFVPGIVTVSLRSSTGEMFVDPIIEDAMNLKELDPIGVAFSETDRALHVVWTANDGRTTRVMRQRFVCRASVSSPE